MSDGLFSRKRESRRKAVFRISPTTSASSTRVACSSYASEKFDVLVLHESLRQHRVGLLRGFASLGRAMSGARHARSSDCTSVHVAAPTGREQPTRAAHKSGQMFAVEIRQDEEFNFFWMAMTSCMHARVDDALS